MAKQTFNWGVADPAGINYPENPRNNPQNGYRSYDAPGIFLDNKSWNDVAVAHERLSHEGVIARANGGNPSDGSAVGHYVSDDKGA